MVDTIYNHRAVNYGFAGQMNFPHDVKQVEFSPQGTFNQNITSSDTLNFVINETSGLLNPITTMAEIVVDVTGNGSLADDAVYTNKLLQLDNSAHSFISSMVITCGDKELERIMNYDQLGSIIKDISYDNSKKTRKDYEGNGGIDFPSLPSYSSIYQACPLVNDNTIKPFSGYFPQYPQNYYLDSNSRLQTQSTATANWATRNFIQNYTQLSFTPWSNTGGTTYSAGADNNETDNNWNDNSRTAALRSTPALNGLYQPFNPVFGTNGYEPYFSQTLNVRYLKNGFVKCDKPTTMTFQIPLLSAIFGCLLPPENWKLIPLKYLPNLTFQFTFNPYALFTSWWTTDQSCRNYTVKKFTLKCELVKLNDPGMVLQIDNEYRQNGIRIPTEMWYYGPTFSIFNGVLPSNLQIGVPCKSLRNLFFLFNSNDYTANAAFRKHYRLSMALTSVQLQLGTDFYPQQPISGNGGTNFGLINNNEFVKNLWKCFGTHTHQPSGIINQHNFAINCREADPTFTATDFTGNNCFAFIMENRIIGKALYGIPLDPLNYEGKMWSGKDTTETNPILLNLIGDTSRVFPRAVTLHTWLHHDALIIISPDGIEVIGRGMKNNSN